MKSIASGFCVAFSMYSALPMPQLKWEKATMRYALCFLPLVGVLVGGLEWGWHLLAVRLGMAPLLYAVVAALLPQFVSGGIHLDGLTDTCDALCSYGDREKRLEIMKDPHVGAFGVFWMAAVLLLEIGLFAQIYDRPAALSAACIGFVLARALGGRAIVALPCAKNTGLAHIFAENSERTRTRWTLTLEILLCCALLLDWNLWVGGACVLLAALWMLGHARLCKGTFGGITGDLAGFLITTTEGLALAVAALGGLLL